jgi:hypothetical protein
MYRSLSWQAQESGIVTSSAVSPLQAILKVTQPPSTDNSSTVLHAQPCQAWNVATEPSSNHALPELCIHVAWDAGGASGRHSLGTAGSEARERRPGEGAAAAAPRCRMRAEPALPAPVLDALQELAGGELPWVYLGNYGSKHSTVLARAGYFKGSAGTSGPEHLLLMMYIAFSHRRWVCSFSIPISLVYSVHFTYTKTSA